MFETTILYLLHALAHHDDFGTETRDLENFTIYIDFFVESVGNSENASLLYHLAGQLKTVKDRQDNNYPEVTNRCVLGGLR
jgi:sister-chromatid-cohesion protein PDS5